MSYNFYNVKLQKESSTSPIELLVDGSFEAYTGSGLPAPWYAYAEAVSGVNINGDFGGYVRTGSYSISPSNLTSGNCYAYQDITVEPETSYSLSIWTRGDGSVGGRYSVYNLTTPGDIIAVTPTGVTGLTYTEVTDTIEVPAGCTSIQIRLWAPTAFGEATYDDISVLGSGTASGESLLYTPIGVHLGQLKKSGQGQSFNLSLKSSVAAVEYLLTESYVVIETESEGIERE